MNRSPLAPGHFPDLPPVAGVELRTARAGYKVWDRDDMLIVLFHAGTTVAGMTTKSLCPSPEVELCRAHLGQGKAAALIVNAGNSNAFTGAIGKAATAALASHLASRLGCAVGHVFASSTGVIGVPLPVDRGLAGINEAISAEPCGWETAAMAITTTDTFPKGATRTVQIGGVPVTLVGIIKGSGMIAPDMATMLGYIFTDAAVAPQALQAMIEAANDVSFSCITVDGDTSTSDTVLAFATGCAGNAELTTADPDFAAALADLCRDLARLVVRDGEGATKFIEIAVTGAVSDESARKIGLSIANSPLVKTAVAGGDANWGRVVMAVGKAGEPADRDRLSIAFGRIEVAREGAAVPGYDEAPVTAHLAKRDIGIDVGIGLGNGRATVWTCDLTHDYISINADYRS